MSDLIFDALTFFTYRSIAGLYFLKIFKDYACTRKYVDDFSVIHTLMQLIDAVSCSTSICHLIVNIGFCLNSLF